MQPLAPSADRFLEILFLPTLHCQDFLALVTYSTLCATPEFTDRTSCRLNCTIDAVNGSSDVRRIEQ